MEVSWYQKKPALSLRFIHNTQVALDAPIIDVGGGASTLVDCLCDEGYTGVTVLDVSSKALAFARERLGDNANRIEWVENDIIYFKPKHRFSLWHDRAVFHFLTEKADRSNYVSVLKRVLNPGGHLIIAAFAINGPTKCSGLDIVQYDADKLLAELGDGFGLVEVENEVHITPAAGKQKFTYFRFIRKQEDSNT